MIDHKSRFSFNLRALREAKGLTQRELAQRIGMSRASIIAWEDTSNPTMPQGGVTIARLAKELGTTVENLKFKDVLASAGSTPMVREPMLTSDGPSLRYHGRNLPRMVEVVARTFELDALAKMGASEQEMGVVRAALYSPEMVLMFSGGYDDVPMTPDEQVVEMEALVEKLRAWLTERVRRRTQATKKKR